MTDLAMRDMESAIETIAMSRRLASLYRQAGFPSLAEYHRDNARGAERWLIQAGRAYPRRCDATGKPMPE